MSIGVVLLDDMVSKLQSILNDEESMRQVMELAQMFSAGEANSGSEGDGAPAQGYEENGGAYESGTPLSGGGSPLGGIDIAAMLRLLNSVNGDDKNRNLLIALRPHLKEEKREKLDRAIKLLKLYDIFITMRENGILGDLENLL
jgi:hypothetical protein